jgi:single-strand DNA-binding protein
MAVNRSFMSQGEKKQEKCFIDLVAFGPIADLINKFTKKGKEIFVEGHLTMSEWTTKDSKEKRSKLQVTVDHIQLLGAPQSKDAEEEPDPFKD